MRWTGKYFALLFVFLVSTVILSLILRWCLWHTEGVGIQEARDTCDCSDDSSRIVVLRISNKGETTIGSEQVSGSQLAARLRDIYATRAERVLYVFPENGVPIQRIAGVIKMVQHLESERVGEPVVPVELRARPENMNIQIKLVTPRALNSPCPHNCFNWAVEGTPILP